MRIYFAGAETLDNTAPILRAAGAQNLFVSYYHLTARTDNVARHARVMHHYTQLGMRQVIDSGAFTFMAARKAAMRGARRGTDTAGAQAASADLARVLADLEVYFARYIAWVERNWTLLTDFVELDMQRIVGPVPVQRWRRILRDRGLLEKAWLVHHSCDDWAHFEAMVAMSQVCNGGSGHCGIEGRNLSKEGEIDYDRHARYAYEHGVCIHAFASTRAKFLASAPLTSSDSTSWESIWRYGCDAVYDPVRCGVVNRRPSDGFGPRGVGELQVVSHAWLSQLASPEPRSEKRNAGDRIAVNAVKAFLQMEQALTDLWEHRGIDWRRVEDQIAKEKGQ